MEITLEDAKNLAEIAKPFISPIINVLLKPSLKKLGDWIHKRDVDGKLIDNYWEDKFEKYLENVYSNSSFLTTLVFPNQQIKLKDLYVPLTITCSKDHKSFEMNTIDFSFLDRYGKLIISDTAGMGKSTLLKWITIALIEQTKSIPILIELRKIDEDNTVLNEIFNQIDPIDKSFDKDLVYKFLDLGFFTILFDGFDEIPFELQSKITKEMRDFIKKTSSNKFIITSRPESALASFADFQSFFIKPLSTGEAFNLINKLDSLSKVKYGSKLIEEINEKNEQVHEFLSNPFLVSLLYKSYTYNKDIPSKKVTFYEEVYTCLFKHHDLSKEGFKRPKKSRLDILDFEIILRNLGFETTKVGKVIYTKDELIEFIEQAKKNNSRIEFKEQNFLEDLTSTVPLFTYEGNKIKWAHKSIQDFFAAKFISNHSRKEDIIAKIYDSNKFQYLNILDLLYELEPLIFQKKIIKDILEKFIKHYRKYNFEKFLVDKKQVEARITLTFGITVGILRTKKDIGFQKARKLFASELGKKDLINTGATYNLGESLYTLFEFSIISEIIKLLSNKNENIFQETIKRKRTKINMSDFDIDKVYLIDQDYSQPYNSSSNFEGVNDLLNDFSLSRRYENKKVLDFAKCKRQLIKIEKEIKLHESKDLLFDL